MSSGGWSSAPGRRRWDSRWRSSPRAARAFDAEHEIAFLDARAVRGAASGQARDDQVALVLLRVHAEPRTRGLRAFSRGGHLAEDRFDQVDRDEHVRMHVLSLDVLLKQ